MTDIQALTVFPVEDGWSTAYGEHLRAKRAEFFLALVIACKADRNDWKARAQRAEFLLALALATKMEPPAAFIEWAAERNADYANERAGINPRAHRYNQ